MNSAIRFLVVSYTFPPDAEVGGLRIARLCRYLPEHGIQPIVLSVEDRFYEALDHSFALPEQVQVFRTGAMSTPLDWYRLVKCRLTSGTAQSDSIQKDGVDKSFLRRQLLALLNLPDRYWGWYFPAVKAAEKLIEKEKIDVIFSSGPPWIPHLIARHLKTRYKLPWVADFRDPWAHFLPEKKDPAWWQHFLERLEDRCIRSADMVVCTTERLRQAFQRHYADLDGSKFRTLTNGYEDFLVPSKVPPASDKRVFLHLGSIYGLRRIDTFLLAIAELTRSGKLDSNSFRLVFQGEISSRFIAAAKDGLRELRKGCVEFRPRVSREEAQRILWSADRLLLFQGNHELQVPAKFYEYLKTGIPIFAVTEEGALTDLLTSTRSGLWARTGDPKEIAERFLQVLQLPRQSPDHVQRNLSGKFDCRQLASQLSEWVHELVGRREELKPSVGPLC